MTSVGTNIANSRRARAAASEPDQLAPEFKRLHPLNEIHASRQGMRRRSRSPVGGITKRGFDLAVAIPLFLVLFPVLVLVGLGVMTTSRGPAIFAQRRAGLHSQPFIIYKFRTMRTRDDGSKITQAQKGDSRVTPLGAFLRSTSVDELPQLINVIKGDMSLVGPRPHAVAHDKEFAAAIPNYKRRWKARPGITGLAQISGCRGIIEKPEDIQRRADMDEKYVNKWSLAGDVKIILATLKVVVNDEKAF